MADPRRIIGPVPPSTTPMPGGAHVLRPLPPDLLRDASRRLGILALLAAVLWVVGTILYHVSLRATPIGADWMVPLGGDAFVIPGIVASIALYAYSRRSTQDPRIILDVGLGYMIFTAALLGLLFHWDSMPGNMSIAPIITWTGVITLIFAAMVPSTPMKTLVAGVLAVSMNPVGMLIARARGVWPFEPASGALLMHYPDYLLVGVSVVIAHVLTGLGHQVAHAREMGSYQLGELLGKGGMGEVYSAKHRMLARPAAIKLIRPDVVAARGESAKLAVSRFRREAEVAAKLRSPHTVELYDFGVTDEGTLYFVMELLEGMTLEALVRATGPVPAGRAVHLLQQVCDSLEEAHATGLVHRDIKPANIHVGRVGLRDDFVKVLDFGLVKTVSQPDLELTMAAMETMATGASMQTNLALTPGTPAYMAPELLRGETIDGRADIYALGCVAYFLITGALVFEATTVVQMLAQHLTAAPVPPSERTEVPVPAMLDAIVLACLAKSPKDRPQTAGAVAEQLARVPVEVWDEARAAAWWQMQR